VSDSGGTPTIRDDRPHQRFVLEKDGAVGELAYEVEGDGLFLLHTEVADALRGQGVAGQLVTAAVSRAIDDGLTVVPWCPYARRWLHEHPDIAATVSVDWSTPPRNK
jgi:predicted GNAT family acetyltransferase